MGLIAKLTHAGWACDQDGELDASIRGSKHTSDPGAEAEADDCAPVQIEIFSKRKVV